MSKANGFARDVLDQISTDPKVLSAARDRRDAVKSVALEFEGMRRAYNAGSIAMGVVNDPVFDADSGVVIDRRTYPKLGPDGKCHPPTSIIEDLHDFIGRGIRTTYESATVHDMKRGLTVRFHDPVIGDQDPFVDLVVAIEREGAAGLWIPNLNSNLWDPSDPEGHVALVLAGPAELRRIRGHVIRLGKAWNKQYADPALSSFNIVALALECIQKAEDIADALLRFFEHAVTSLRERRTSDPSGVSEAIKLPLGKDTAIERLVKARDNMRTAVTASDVVDQLDAMHRVFWNYLPESCTGSSKGEVANALRSSAPRVSASGLFVGAMKPARAFGDSSGR